MESSNQTVSPLRQRMIEDMRMRKLGEKTQVTYIRAVRKLAAYLKRSPDTATVEELRRFQLHLIDQGTSPGTLNATLSGLKFFFDSRWNWNAGLHQTHYRKTVIAQRPQVAENRSPNFHMTDSLRVIQVHNFLQT